MDGDLREILGKGARKLTDKQYRKLYGKLDEIRSNLGKLYYKRTKAKKANDAKEVRKLTSVINKVKATRLDLTAEVKNQYIVKLGTKKIIIKKSTLKKSKNPTKYVENKMKEWGTKQIKTEIKKGNLKQASYLMRLQNAFKYKTKNKKKDKELEVLNEEIEKKSKKEFGSWDAIQESIQEFLFPDTMYKPIITVKGNVINVTKVG